MCVCVCVCVCVVGIRMRSRRCQEIYYRIWKNYEAVGTCSKVEKDGLAESDNFCLNYFIKGENQ